MTSKERVLAAIDHREPDRVPFDLTSTLVTGIHYVAYEKLRNYLGMPKKKTRIFDQVQGLARVDDDLLKYLEVDTRGVLTGNFSGWELEIKETESYEQFDDAWGVTWRRPKPYGLYYEMARHPLRGATIPDVKKYRWPEPRDERRLADLKRESSELAKTDCLVVLGTTGLTSGLLQTFEFLMGFEDAYCSLAGDEKLSTYLVQKLAELDIEFWEWAIPYLGDDIRVVLYADDFGTQNGPALSYETFQKYFKPLVLQDLFMYKVPTQRSQDLFPYLRFFPICFSRPYRKWRGHIESRAIHRQGHGPGSTKKRLWIKGDFLGRRYRYSESSTPRQCQRSQGGSKEAIGCFRAGGRVRVQYRSQHPGRRSARKHHGHVESPA